MIYIFKACGGICDGCGKACDQCCKECGHVCDPLCKVIDRPLGGYVLLAVVLNVPAALFGVASLGDEEVRSCDAHPLTLFCVLVVVCGIIHTAFAFYLQNRLVHGLQNGALIDARTSGPADLNSKELMNRAAHIVMYDVGFCLYVFFFLASFFFMFAGFSWIGTCDTGSSWPWFGTVLLTLFGFLASGFAVLWFFALACDQCCAGLLGVRTVATGEPGQRPPNRGVARIVFGKNGGLADARSRAAGGMAAVQGVVGGHFGGAGGPRPSGGAAVPPPATVMGAPADQGPYAAPPPGRPHPPPAGQPPPGSETPAERAAKVAGTGLQMAGQGFQAAGRWLSKGKDQRAGAAGSGQK